MVSSERKTALFMGFGSVFVLLGAMAVVFWPALFLTQLQNMMIVTNTSQSFDLWRETPLPMYLECFMFNITNVAEILAGTAQKVEVAQIGPYVYRESHTKTNITFNDNSTVTFYNQRFWHYEPEMSNGSLSDQLTSVNPVVASVAYFMRHRSTLGNLPIDVFLRMYHRNMFVTANVSDWLFDGIQDPILDIAERFPEIVQIPYDKFGWFYDRNGSIEFDGVFLMDTGADDFSQLGNIVKWRNSDRTIYRDECGKVRGSTGELWAPELGQQNVEIFASDVCSYLTLHINDTITVEGIQGVMYAANDSVFDNGYNYPGMACYCDTVRDSNCLPPGALNVSACRLGAPAFVSMPHFYNSDPYYPAKIDGLSPNEDHRFRLALEMFTGIPLYVAAQLQINLLIRHIGGISINNQLPDSDTLVPMFWFRQEVRITPEYAQLAKFALNVRYRVPYAFYAITTVGVVLLIAGITLLIKKILNSPENKPILESNADDELTQ